MGNAITDLIAPKHAMSVADVLRVSSANLQALMHNGALFWTPEERETLKTWLLRINEAAAPMIPPAPIPDFEPGAEGNVRVRVVFDLGISAADLAKAGAIAAADGSFTMTDEPGNIDTWGDYRRTRAGGPIAADLAEVLVSAIATAFPLGGYDIGNIDVTHAPEA